MIDQLRADLATVTAEVDERHAKLVEVADKLQAERAAHAETARKLELSHGSLRALALDLAHTRAERDSNTREFGRLYGEQDKSRAEAYQRLETERESIAAYLEHVASVEVGTILSVREREIVGLCAAWVRNQLDRKRDAEPEAETFPEYEGQGL
jgi:septal ring factor EnvC (AmiA/AmiB activator)